MSTITDNGHILFTMRYPQCPRPAVQRACLHHEWAHFSQHHTRNGWPPRTCPEDYRRLKGVCIGVRREQYTVVTEAHLGGRSDLQARPTQEESGAIVTSGD